MARHRQRQRSKPYWIDWTPAVASLFDLPPPHWTPPAKAKVHRAATHLTITARYMTPDGHPSTARARVALTSDGGGIQTSEELDTRAVYAATGDLHHG
jgi:hypothetical protein